MKIIDFHSHILPGVDHGSYHLETSLKQLELAKSAGVNGIIATSHFYPHVHFVEGFVVKRANAYERLANSMPAGIDIKLGAEVLLFNSLDKLPGLSQLCFLGTNVMLMELPFNSFTQELEETIKEMLSQNYEIIIAHADRYPRYIIENLLPLGLKLQLNADALDKMFRQKHLYEWIDKGYVIGLGSDIHNVDKLAYKHFSAVEKKIGTEAYFEIMKSSNSYFERIAAYKK